MALKINLLPDNFAVKGTLARSLALVKQLTIVLLAVFILIVVGISGYFFVSSFELGRITVNIESLKSQIMEQETVETQMVLLKDRISKIKIAQKSVSSQQSLTQVDSLFSSIPQGVTLGQLSVDSTKSEASISFDSSLTLTDFFKTITSSTNFSSIILTSFGFNPATGYLASFRLVGK